MCFDWLIKLLSMSVDLKYFTPATKPLKSYLLVGSPGQVANPHRWWTPEPVTTPLGIVAIVTVPTTKAIDVENFTPTVQSVTTFHIQSGTRCFSTRLSWTPQPVSLVIHRLQCNGAPCCITVVNSLVTLPLTQAEHQHSTPFCHATPLSFTHKTCC